MCGIGGILRIVKPGEAGYVDPAELDARLRIEADPRKNPSAWLIPEEWLDAIDKEIAWRGPDGQGRFRDRVVRADGTIVEVALVHRRLAIIDLECGAQPMVVDGCAACAREAEERRAQQRAAHKKKDAAPPDEVVSSSGYLLYDPSSNDPVELRAGTPHLASVVFNGCIYNHRELRKELEEKGHGFTTDHSDTEVVLHSFRAVRHAMEWDDSTHGGDDFGPLWSPIHHWIDGMYAQAIWNRSHGELALARDRAGEKPMHVASVNAAGCLVFASAPNGLPVSKKLGHACELWAHRPVHSKERDHLADWLSMGWSADSLPDDRGVPLWQGAHVVGSFPKSSPLSWKGMIGAGLGGGVMLVLFFAAVAGLIWLGYYLLSLIVASGGAWLLLKAPIPFVLKAMHDRSRGGSGAHVPDRFDEAMSDAVLSRLDSDVPLGCFLSGGVDSSLIAHYAREHLGDLTTLTVRMPSEAHDESRWARLVADHLGTRHVEVECDGTHAAEDLVRIIETMGLPFGDSSILPTYWLCREARNHVKVGLAGDGGDELFYGYERYRAMKYLGFRRFLLKVIPIGRLDRSDSRSRDERLARLVTAARHGGYTDLLAVFPTPDRRELIGRRAGLFCKTRVFEGAAAARNNDLGSYLSGDLLRKVDTASMMCGLEVRCPYLAPGVIHAASTVGHRKHMRGETKHLLKELARKHLPPEIADRPKQGFAIPISDWFRTDFGGLRTLLLDSLAGERPFGRVHDVLPINMAFVRRMLDEHWAAGGLTPIHTSRAVRKRDHGQRLFALVSLAIWSRQEGLHRRGTEDAEKTRNW